MERIEGGGEKRDYISRSSKAKGITRQYSSLQLRVRKKRILRQNLEGRNGVRVEKDLYLRATAERKNGSEISVFGNLHKGGKSLFRSKKRKRG